MPTINHTDLGDIVKHVFKTATISSVDDINDTADIAGDVAGTAVPIFYHCANTNLERANGAIGGAAAAFFDGDEVVVMCEVESGAKVTPLRIVAHTGEPQACGFYEDFRTGVNAQLDMIDDGTNDADVRWIDREYSGYQYWTERNTTSDYEDYSLPYWMPTRIYSLPTFEADGLHTCVFDWDMVTGGDLCSGLYSVIQWDTAAQNGAGFSAQVPGTTMKIQYSVTTEGGYPVTGEGHTGAWIHFVSDGNDYWFTIYGEGPKCAYDPEPTVSDTWASSNDGTTSIDLSTYGITKPITKIEVGLWNYYHTTIYLVFGFLKLY